MTSPTGSLDTRLYGLLQGLDTSAGFDERVMARAHAELAATAARGLARAEEAQRYELAKRRQSWGAWIRRGVTLDTVGLAALAGLLVHTLWRAQAVHDAGQFVSGHVPETATAFGVLLALATLPALLLQRRRPHAWLA